MTQAATFISSTYTPGAPDFAAVLDEDEQLTVMARVRGPSGGFVLRSHLSNVYLYVRNRSTLAVTGPVTLGTSVVVDSLSNDERWTEDGAGFNFELVLDGETYFSSPGGYDIRVRFDESSGEEYSLRGFVSARGNIS